MKATIFDIQRNSFVDGPGIRTTVFFKGCNLRCAWCHNPESQNGEKEILFYREKCTGCGRCSDLTTDSTEFICYYDAKEICGKTYTTDEVMREILKDKAYYDASGGGATFSGGECMLQIEFLEEILKKCMENGVNTAVDTAGNVPFEYFEKIMPYTDLFLYDVKAIDSAVHKKYTGVGNELILKNLKNLFEKKANVCVRIPIIGGVNDGDDEFEKMKNFFAESGLPNSLEVLPYHAMGEHKYAALGKTATKFSVPEEAIVCKFKTLVLR